MVLNILIILWNNVLYLVYFR